VEILAQMDGKVDAWVASIGTGGTMLGVAQRLKAANPDLIVSGVVPTDDPRLEWVRSRAVHTFLERFGLPEMRFIIEDILAEEILDQEIVVQNEDAKDMADRLCREEGLFCGISSGANVHAAVELARGMPNGSRIVTVLVDRRDRYFAEFPHEHYVV
jgi:cysteine synthase A